jgi:tetratricopeptide (TPR) repeat protein
VDAAELVDSLTSGFTDDLSARVVESAEGNPLFLEQFCAMADESKELTVPPSIQGLLAARIDQLPAEERAVAERGAIEGRLFHRGSVSELSESAARPKVAAQLSSLVRRDLIRPAESLLVGDDGYRFAHALVREAVYSATPKAVRAKLHEQFADWLERSGDNAFAKLEEILGYHLEQAHTLQREVTPPDEHTRDLGVRAAGLLGLAGRRASNRGDYIAAQNLLERAVATDPRDDRARPRYLLDLAETTVRTKSMAEALLLAEQARNEALNDNDGANQARAELLIADIQGQQAELSAAELRAVADRALEVLGPLDDDHWMARAWQAKATATNYDGGGSTTGTFELTERFSREALRLARRDGDGPATVLALVFQVWSRVFGATPVETAMATCEELQTVTDTKQAKASIDGGYGYLLALTGQTADGRRHAEDSRRFHYEAGDKMSYAGTAFFHSEIEIWDHDLDAAEQTLDEASRILEEMGEDGYRSTVIVYLGYVHLLRGDHERAEALVHEGLSLSGDDDIANEIWSRRVLAPIHAARGELDVAERLAREAIDLSALNSPLAQGETRLVLARILRQSGREAESREAAGEAVRIFEQKGAKLLLPEALALARGTSASI